MSIKLGRARVPVLLSRRAVCLLAVSTALALALVVPSAQAAPTASSYFFFGTSPSVNGFADVFYPATTNTDVLRIDLVRGGTVIASSGNSQPGNPEVSTSPPNNGPLVAGDVANFYKNGVLVTRETYDGTPTINSDACVGSTSFTGTRNPSGTVTQAGAFRPSSGSGGSDVKGTVTNTDTNTYSVALNSALQSTDQPFATENYLNTAALDGADSITSELILPSTPACPAATAGGGGGGTTTTNTTSTNKTTNTVAIVPAGPSLAQVFAALQSALAAFGVQLHSFTPATLGNHKFVFYSAALLEGGTEAITMYIYVTPQGVAARSAKTKKIKLASGTASLKTAGRVKIKLNLSAKGRKALKRSRKARLGLVTTFTPTNGAGKQTASSSITLRAKKTAKKKKK